MTVVITRPVRHKVIVRAPGPRGAAGRSVTDVTIDDDGHLIFTLSDDSVIDAGEVVTSGGSSGDGSSGGGSVDSVAAGNATVTVDSTDPANPTIVVTPNAFIAGDDLRLSDERIPTAHGESHGDDGSDRLTLDASQIATGILDDALIPSTVARDGDVTTAVDSEATARNTAIDAAIANLISSAPGALDTLNELAAALGDDPNFAATITNALAGLGSAATHAHSDYDPAGSAAAAQAESQPLNDGLTAIADLVPANDDIVQRKEGVWANRTLAQVKDDLGISDEALQDIVGAMATSNAEDGAGLVYNDTTGKLDVGLHANKLLPPPLTSQNFDRRLCTNSGVTLVSGRLHCTAHWFEAGTVVSGLTIQRNSNMATPTNQWAAILNSSYVPVATTVDQTTTPMAFVGSRRYVFATPYVVPTSGVYYLGFVAAAATPGQLVAANHSTILWATTPTPILAFMSTQTLTTPASMNSPVVPATLQSSLWFGID